MKHFFKFTIFVTIVFVLFASCSEGKYKNKRNLTIAFYNVENLFDTIDNPHKNDNEFLPASKKRWSEKRYEKKIEDLAKVLGSINENELPEIIGLCEVENRAVVADLVKSEPLRKGKYKIIHYESPDFRGIDCALIYRPNEFKVLTSFPIRVKFRDKPNYTTRDILYVKGKTKNREILHIFVNHWPSRIGGLAKSEPRRVEVATLLKSKIDSILTGSPEANIIVMGDMNDEPSNKSLAEVLGAQKPESANAELVNLMYPVHENKMGSYLYRGNWNMLDNLVVSKSLLDDNGFRCTPEKGFVFHEKWMEYKNKKGEISPNRTYGGPNYYGGISDHFPVYFMLKR